METMGRVLKKKPTEKEKKKKWEGPEDSMTGREKNRRAQGPCRKHVRDRKRRKKKSGQRKEDQLRMAKLARVEVMRQGERPKVAKNQKKANKKEKEKKKKTLENR